jgi:hypothetical protein
MSGKRCELRLLLSLSLAFTFSACALEAADDGPGGGDCYDNPAACIAGVGEHHGYVVDKATLPATATEAQWLGLDLDNDANGRIDNQLGAILAALASVTGGVLQEAFDTGISTGEAIILVDIQTPSFADASGAGIRIRLGADANPPPCVDENDTVCGGHLQGGASFGIDTVMVLDLVGPGEFRSGELYAGPIEASFTLELDILTRPLNLTLIGGRAEATVTENGIEGVVGGGVSLDLVMQEVLPAVIDLAEQDCAGGDPCCTPESAGAALVELFDEDADCVITVQELAESDLLAMLLRADVDLLDGSGNYAPGEDGELDSIALGLGFTAVSANVPVD